MADQFQRIAVVTGAGSGIGAAVAHALAGDGGGVVWPAAAPVPWPRWPNGAPGCPACSTRSRPTSPTRRRCGPCSTGRSSGTAGSTCCSTTPVRVRQPRDLDAVPLAEWNAVVAVNPHRGIPLHPRGVPGHAPPAAARGSHRQQRLDFRPRPRPRSATYTATKHAITGLTRATSLDGRAFDIACGQIGIGNAATDLTEPMAAGVPQADGSIRSEPRIDVTDVARAVRYMADLPLDANVATMTVMATKMPFIRRG